VGAASSESLASLSGLLEVALHCIQDGVVIVDRKGSFLFFNQAAERVVGVGAVDVPPPEWPRVYGCYLPDKVTLYPWEQLPLVRAMRGEHVHEADIYIRNTKNPSGTWINVNSSPLYDEAGRHSGGVIVFRDVSAHRHSQEVLPRLSEAVERTTDSVFITDADGIIEYVNPAFETTTGHTREEALEVLAAERQSDAWQIVDKLYATIKEFAGENPPCDDITAVVAKVASTR
jgi:PAS domain S-box-containing protein